MAPPSSPDPDRPTSSRPTQPVIWAEGRQAPSFSLRAFGRVSLLLARQDVGPVLDGIARKLTAGAAAVAAGRGRIPAHRLGHSGQYLPSYTTVAAGLGAVAQTLRGASDLVLPPPAPVEPLAFPDLISLAPKSLRKAQRLAETAPLTLAPTESAPPAKPGAPSGFVPLSAADTARTTSADGTALATPLKRRARPAPLPPIPVEPAEEAKTDPKPGSDPQLDAIRALLAEVQSIPSPPPPKPKVPAARIALVPRRPAALRREGETPVPLVARPVPPPPTGPAPLRALKAAGRWIGSRKPIRALRSATARALANGAAKIIGWGATGLAMPFAAIKALMIHLNGQDLRRID